LRLHLLVAVLLLVDESCACKLATGKRIKERATRTAKPGRTRRSMDSIVMPLELNGRQKRSSAEAVLMRTKKHAVETLRASGGFLPDWGLPTPGMPHCKFLQQRGPESGISFGRSPRQDELPGIVFHSAQAM
jgi:hypothetical protein